ncbi:Protein of uncharacterised function (DUF3108) [Kingella potus]|uniref:Protein of uncharacterized function (DUF3108) n=1 Tax=Kingella potus TaxID=265175 RepID=A0A377QY91_9NEIS|nr:DUF3108 domain-containing protein [Kingella potus]UOP01706.1 DUF3108 domain-containing protein [Kingella potus]STQ99987.1 Protein of uncharacterised function (DUF3108) [Kingella potus]
MKALFPVLALAAALSAQAAELPQTAELQYSGPYGIPATMTFTRSGSGYTIVSVIKVPLYNFRFESGGSISGKLLHPAYYKDIRKGKTYAEAKFGGGKITYGKSGETQTEAAAGQILDLFALSWQLAATDGKLPDGLRITNGKRIYNIGGLTKTGSAQYAFSGGKTQVDNYRVRRGDDTVHYSFAPAFGNIPAKITYTDNGKTYDLKLTGLKINGQAVKP